MTDEPIGIIHPGEMGAAVAGELVHQGRDVCFASNGRSPATLARAKRFALRDVGDTDALFAQCAVVLSICPPDAAVAVARSAGGFGGVFVDANAVAPRTARAVAEIVEAAGATFVDGGIVGNPPDEKTSPRLYLSGAGADVVAALFSGTRVLARVVSEDSSAASAVKMAYAAWTKGTSAMILAVRAFARAAGVEETLLAEWSESTPEVIERSARAASSARTKAWRWTGEMEEIAISFGDEDLPRGFHEAAAEIYRRSSPEGSASDLASLDEVLDSVLDLESAQRHRRAMEL